jgi:hypothetical protein
LRQSKSGQVGSFVAAYLNHDYGDWVSEVSVPYESTYLLWPRRSSTHQFHFIHLNSKDEQQWIEILSHRPKWYVVMRVVVVHAPRSVHATRHFGILGVSPVQIVDIRDQKKIHALYDLAEAYETENSKVHSPQSFYRSSVQEMERFLRDLFTSSFNSTEMPSEPATGGNVSLVSTDVQ